MYAKRVPLITLHTFLFHLNSSFVTHFPSFIHASSPPILFHHQMYSTSTYAPFHLSPNSPCFIFLPSPPLTIFHHQIHVQSPTHLPSYLPPTYIRIFSSSHRQHIFQMLPAATFCPSLRTSPLINFSASFDPPTYSSKYEINPRIIIF